MKPRSIILATGLALVMMPLFLDVASAGNGLGSVPLVKDVAGTSDSTTANFVNASAGQVGATAGAFDSVSSYARFATGASTWGMNGLQKMSAGLWVQPTSLGGFPSLVAATSGAGCVTAGGCDFQIAIYNNNTFAFTVGQTNGVSCVGPQTTWSTTIAKPNVWYNVVGVLDTTLGTPGTRLKIYVNGTLENQASMNANVVSCGDGTTVPALGIDSDVSSDKCACVLDQVTLWNTALAAGDVTTFVSSGTALTPIHQYGFEPFAAPTNLGKPWFVHAGTGTCSGTPSSMTKTNTTPGAPSPPGTRVNWDANGTASMTTDGDLTTYGEIDDTTPCGGATCDSNHGGSATIGSPLGSPNFAFYNAWVDVNLTYPSTGVFNVTSASGTFAYNFPSASTAPGGLCIGVYGHQPASNAWVYLATWQITTRNVAQSFNSSLGVGFNVDDIRLVPWQSCCGGFLFWEAYDLNVQGTNAAVTSAPVLVGSSGNAQASLTWTSVAGATKYSVWRGVGVSCNSVTPMNGSTCAYLTTVSGLSLVDSPLTNGATYHYRVAGVNDAPSEGPASNEVLVTPSLNPTTVTATGYANCTVQVNWTSVGGALSYVVNQSDYSYVGKPFVTIANVTAPTLTYWTAPLGSGSSYAFTVAPYDGTFGSSNVASVALPKCVSGLIGSSTGANPIYGAEPQAQTALASALGVGVGSVNVLLSILIIMVCASTLYVFTRGNILATGAGGAVGVAISLAMGLFPLWALVFLIVGLAAVGGLAFRSGSSGGN